MDLVTIQVSGLVPGEPSRLYAAWLDASQHGSFVGGKDVQIEAKSGGAIVTGGGRYTGKVSKLKTGAYIGFTLRSPDFPDDAEDSRVLIEFEGRDDGTTTLVISHSRLPAPLVPEFESHWLDHYIMPMRMYFTAMIEAEASADTPAESKSADSKKPPAKKTTAAKKTTGAKKSAAKSEPATAKKAAAKKAPAKKATTKKTAAAKKSPAKKAVAKKAPAKKASTKKKTAAKKR